MLLRQTGSRSGGSTIADGEQGGLSTYLYGAPFLLAAATPFLAFSPAAVLAGFVLAMLAFFTVQLPVTAALLAPANAASPEFPLSRRVYAALLGVWTLTAWLASAAYS